MDDARTTSSLAASMLLQYLTTCITCLVLTPTRSWSLTLVILSAVPLLTFVQALPQSLTSPSEWIETATAATLVDCALASIATVKAFNAVPFEQKTFDTVLHRLNLTSKKLNAVGGATSAAAQFVTVVMSVQGFWFGAKLIREGKIGAGDVMAVFWACLITTSNLQMCIPRFITLTKGKFAVITLLTLVEDRSATLPGAFPQLPHVLSSPSILSHKCSIPLTTIPIHKIIPPRTCAGKISLSKISFTYPTRPSLPVLSNVSLYLPARELTFIIGSSGSGKSTVAQLLLDMYQAQSGTVTLDDTDLRYPWLEKTYVELGRALGMLFWRERVSERMSLWAYRAQLNRWLRRRVVLRYFTSL
jgi:ATP-binding cassette subfamily B (MDR/TAP) protein 1